MSIISRYTFIFLLFKTGILYAFNLAGDQVYVEEVLPLFNVHEKKAYVSSEQKGINPEVINLPDNIKLEVVNDTLEVEGFIGDTVFKDLMLKTDKKHLDVEIKIHNANKSIIKIVPKLVSIWYQSGLTTTQKKHSGALTYELLLSDDRSFFVDDKWIKSNNGGWEYVPPNIELSQM
jgi:hypothetical protein